MTQPNLTDLIRSSRATRPCQLDPNCLFSDGHMCECTTVEIGKHVAKLLDTAMTDAYRTRLDTILKATRAKWLEELVQEGTSPLLHVGWVAQQGYSRSTYRMKTASTWHRDRYCKRNRASGMLAPVLRLEVGSSLTRCAGCAADLSDEEKARMAADYQKLRDRRLELTEGLCWNRDYANCGRDVAPGMTVCEQHFGTVTEACRTGRHAACGGVKAILTRKDGSTYNDDCLCIRCVHPKVRRYDPSTA